MLVDEWSCALLQKSAMLASARESRQKPNFLDSLKAEDELHVDVHERRAKAMPKRYPRKMHRYRSFLVSVGQHLRVEI